MGKLLKVAFVVFIAIPAAAALAFYAFAVHSAKKAEGVDISPSANLISLASEHQLSIPNFSQTDCDSARYYGSSFLSKEASAISFNAVTEEARSAESAAISYQQQGNHQMAAIATSDAISRWRHAWELKADMNCYDIKNRRNSY